MDLVNVANSQVGVLSRVVLNSRVGVFSTLVLNSRVGVLSMLVLNTRVITKALRSTVKACNKEAGPNYYGKLYL